MNVLILGDSLALCGFGERLDERFRNDPRVNATFTYMACGTNPLSWLKQPPYNTVRTQCGYWTIESQGDGKPRVLEDVYGMTSGHTPKAHLVPKLEDMVAAFHPDILVLQTGSNLFGIFPDGKTVQPAKHGPALAKYLAPFKETALEQAGSLRKVYWVNPPTSGRVGAEVQDFLYQQALAKLQPEAVVIDSRTLVTYPYEHMEPDKEHFLGAQMDEWADKVYAIIDQDLARQPLASVRPFAERRQNPETTALVAQPVTIPRAEAVGPEVIPRAEAVAPPAATPTPAAAPTAPPSEPIVIRARLTFKSQPMPTRELLPYRESLVAYVYDVEKVLKGEYDQKQILVMLPAHIDAKDQKLKYRIGKRYKLRLDRLEGSLWETAKTRDETGQINLQPYIRVEDERRHPEGRN